VLPNTFNGDPEEAVVYVVVWHLPMAKRSESKGQTRASGKITKEVQLWYMWQCFDWIVSLLGAAKSYSVWKELFDAISEEKDAVFFYHSYDEDCEGCIHKVGTTLSEGRNLVVSAAANASKIDWNTYKYVVVLDDDVQLLNSSATTTTTSSWNVSKGKFSGENTPTSTVPDVAAWKSFHNRMLEPNTTHPLIKPKCQNYDSDDTATTYQSCPDDNFLAIRRDYVDWVYPYSTIGKQNFWLNILELWKRMERCYPAGILIDHRWTVANPQRRYKINKFPYKNKEWVQTKVLEVLNRDYPTLGQPAWKVDANIMTWHRCTVKQEPSFGMHPECKRASEVRFQRWLPWRVTMSREHPHALFSNRRIDSISATNAFCGLFFGVE
jgi:hypothetical protein